MAFLRLQIRNNTLFHGLVGGIQRIGSAIFAMLFGVAAVRFVGADEFGVYLGIMAVTGLVATLTTFGIPTQLSRELAMERGGGSRDGLGPLVDLTIWLVVGLFLVSGLATASGALHLSLGLFFALLKLALDITIALYVGAERVVEGFWITLFLYPLMAILMLVTLFWLGHIHNGATELFVAQILAALLALVTALVLAPRIASSAIRLVPVPRIRWERVHWGYVRTGVVLALTQALIGLSTQIDILVLSAFRTPAEVAYYHAAARAALVVSMFSGMIAAIAAPTLMRQLSEDSSTAQISTVQRTALSGFIVTVGASAAVLTLGPFYLSLYGPDFRLAYPLLVLLCGAFLAFSAAGPAQMVLRAYQLDQITLWVQVAALTVNVCLSVALVGSLGTLGVALATAIQFVLMGWWMNLACRRQTGLAVGPLAALLSRPWSTK